MINRLDLTVLDSQEKVPTGKKPDQISDAKTRSYLADDKSKSKKKSSAIPLEDTYPLF